MDMPSKRPMDLLAVCRLCLSNRPEALKSMYDEVLSPNKLPQKINWLLQLQISKHDKLSTMVCNDCIIRLDTWFSYKKQCHKNQTKLVEWLNITKQNDGEEESPSMNFCVKQEPLERMDHGMLPVKLEICYDDDEFGEATMSTLQNEFQQSLFEDDMDISALETDDDRRCPDCGRMFGSIQNRKRHQNMMHASRERRSQMMELRKDAPTEKPTEQSKAEEINKSVETEPTSSEAVEDSCVTTSGSGKECEEKMDLEENVAAADESTTETMAVKENGISSEDNSQDTNMSTDETTEVSETPKETSSANPPTETPSNNEESEKAATEATAGNPEADPKEDSADPKEDSDVKSPKPKNEADEKKIEFAAGLRLVQKDSIELEPLSKIELSYIEKCKAMVSMFHTLQCACHNVQHKTSRHMHSHLRDTRIWFPLFTCYNCMISLTDRSTFTKHYSKCERPQFEALMKLSNLRKRSEVKSRLYQNFKCNRCRFLFSFHEDFCRHIDEDHANGSPPLYCSCRYVFDSLEEYKTHCYTSCILSYYCDICFITTPTIEEFIKHAQETHDNSEGFVLLQSDNYVPRATIVKHKEADDEANVIEGKRERRKSVKEPILVSIYDREVPKDLKDIPTRLIKQFIPLPNMPSTSVAWNKIPTPCPFCKKEYSNANNMIRHYRTHIERGEVVIPKLGATETKTEHKTETTGEDGLEDLYTCPDCGGVYPSSKWLKHLEEKHQPKSCSECDKEFQFQSELDQHRSVHLNIKVYKDFKTQSYMVSPTVETNGVLDDVLLMCEICDAMFDSKDELKNHKLTYHDSKNSEQSADNDDQYLSDDNKLACTICNKTYTNQRMLKDHILTQHEGQKYKYPRKCDLCDKVCTTGAAFAMHMQWHDRINPTEDNKSEYPKKCEYCDKMCSSGAGLYLHTQMHERVTLGELKKKKDDVPHIDIDDIDEITDADEESYHTCKRCFKVFGTKFKLKEHMKSHGIVSKTSGKRNRKVLCDLCHASFNDSEALAQHKDEEHGEEEADVKMEPDEDSQSSTNRSTPSVMYACDICEVTFNTKPELRVHKETHNKPKKSANNLCKYCKVSFESFSILARHMHEEHGESAKPKMQPKKVKDDPTKPYKCPTCGKGFVTMGAMTTHYGWHKRKNEDNTPEATAAVKMEKKKKMIGKIAAAAAIKPEPAEIPEFQCTTCFMVLPNDTALQIHRLEKHEDLKAEMLIPRCNTCNKDFKSQEEYETHKRFHDFLERQKRFEQEQQIQTPIIQSVQSVGELSPKKFPCNWCKSVFSRHDTLNTHIKSNHREHVKTEFACHLCDRVFERQNALTIHIKVHQKQKMAASQGPSISTGSGGKTYVCSLCNMNFSFPKDLRAHTINAHPF